ncbi:MAG TPA: hypothetical protein DCM87_14085 [Planctomycetes bacterium]|nr:hypothetical protein [Planctomycetota bacterium]
MKIVPAATVLKAPVGETAGGTIDCSVTLDARVAGVQGWSFGLKIEPAAGATMNISSVAMSQASLTAACGKALGFVDTAYFASTDLTTPVLPKVPADGTVVAGLADCAAVTQGVVVDMMQVCSLGVTAGLRVLDITVDVSGTAGETAAVAGRVVFTNDVGNPPTSTVIVFGGGSIPPEVTASAVITIEPKICTPAAQFTIAIGGGGGATDAEAVSLVTLNLDSDPANPNTAAIQGWSYGLCIKDPAMLDILSATTSGTDSGTFKGGLGPDFNTITVFPGQGVTHGVVIDLMATVTLPAQNDWTDLAVTYKILMTADGQATSVVPCDKALGTPATANVMVVGGNSFPASTSEGIDPADECCDPTSCNAAGTFVYLPGTKAFAGSANGDGKLDIADGIFILNYLYRSGRPLPCEKAGDVNGDCVLDSSDAVYIIYYQFLDGPAPAQGLGCVLFNSDTCPNLTCDVAECG